MHRVGIIPFSVETDGFRLLFVTSQARRRWIFPKGRRKEDEGPLEAASREAFEEAGIIGRLLNDFPITAVVGRQIESDEIEQMPVTYFPMLVEQLTDDWPEKDRRKREWFSVDKALAKVDPDDLRPLILQVAALSPWLTEAAIQPD